MKIVVDTNRIFAALLANGTTRKILFMDFDFYAPEYTKQELTKYFPIIQRRAKLSEEKLTTACEIILNRLKMIPQNEYNKAMPLAKKLIYDPDDACFLALALSLRAVLWTHDKGFLSQDLIKIVTNYDLLKMVQ